MEALILKPRTVGISHLARLQLKFPEHIDAPLEFWRSLHQEAVKAHRTIDEQLMLATGGDLVAMKERKLKCSSSKQQPRCL